MKWPQGQWALETEKPCEGGSGRPGMGCGEEGGEPGEWIPKTHIDPEAQARQSPYSPKGRRACRMGTHANAEWMVHLGKGVVQGDFLKEAGLSLQAGAGREDAGHRV